MQPIRISCTQSVSKAAPWCNSFLQKFGNDLLDYLAFMRNPNYKDFKVFGCQFEDVFTFILKKTENTAHIMMSGVLTSSGDVMPIFLFPCGLRCEGLHQVRGRADLDGEGGWWKTPRLATEVRAMPQKQENPVLAGRKLLRSYHSKHLAA